MTHIDGGIWANCPATVGLIEAISVLGQQPKDIEILSLGTTIKPFHVSPRRRKGGLLFWHKGIIDLLMQAQVAGALAQAKVLSGRKALRINVTTQSGRFAMDNARHIAELRALGIREARHCEHEVSQRFLDTPAEPFVPYHCLSLH